MGDTALMIVQNAENPSVREGKMRLNAGFYAPKKHFYGCDRSSWVYARWHCDDITDTVVTFTQRFRGLVMITSSEISSRS